MSDARPEAPSADVRQLLEAAVRAPSSHNTQPWLFTVDDGQIQLRADRTRALPVNDPHDRELTISCGAALANLELAAARAGHQPSTTLLPDADDPDHLATVELATPAEPVATDNAERVALVDRIEHRHTTRGAFTDDPVPGGCTDDLIRAVADHGCWAQVVDDPDTRRELAHLVGEGDRMQFADPRWRRELASWMQPRRRHEGLTYPELVAPITRLIVTAFDLGRSTAAKDEDLLADAPLVVVLGSDGDDAEAWLHAGRALETMLLTASAGGLQAGYLNQPCQVAELRPRLQHLLGRGGFPQVVLRLGRIGDTPKPSPRRPVDEVLIPPS